MSRLKLQTCQNISLIKVRLPDFRTRNIFVSQQLIEDTETDEKTMAKLKCTNVKRDDTLKFGVKHVKVTFPPRREKEAGVSRVSPSL